MSINWNEANYLGYEWILDKPEEQFYIKDDFGDDRLILSGPSTKLGLSAYQEKKSKGWMEQNITNLRKCGNVMGSAKS